MLAMPKDLRGCCLIQYQSERWLVLPHLASHVVTASELIGKANAILIEDEATNTAKCLSSEELNLGVSIIRLHKTGWVHLHPLKIASLGSNCLSIIRLHKTGWVHLHP